MKISILLFTSAIFLSCGSKNNKKDVVSYDTTEINVISKIEDIPKKTKIVCDTVVAYYLDTKTGDLSFRDEIVCDTLIIN